MMEIVGFCQKNDIISEPTIVEKRGHWGSSLEFLLATIGLTVGLGNVWRFPALAYRNGGSAFLVPYFICAVLFGLPMLYLEMIIGQYTNCGPSMIFRHYMPALQGIGWSMVLISLTVSIYYTVIIAWSFIYLFSSLSGFVPLWGSCDNDWNDICRCLSSLKWTTFKVSTDCGKVSCLFSRNVVTKRSNGIDDIGAINWATFAALSVMWAFVALILVKGYEYMGKVAYLTSTLPYVIIVILFFRGITLDGATEGVYYYLGKPDFGRIFARETWSTALVQICFSLNVGYGGIIVLASYNNRTNNCYKVHFLFDSYMDIIAQCVSKATPFQDAWIVIWGVLIMSVFGGTAVFATLGYLSKQLHKGVDEVVSSGRLCICSDRKVFEAASRKTKGERELWARIHHIRGA
ncbi:unnamed protein product [Heligmosomoides polygyrus]|uniref:Transporter n=1 Tax=Heligmosomoides polygyrus TaxID=6339 RepID=A0A3P7U3L9_HELPZ|nr:unnamed protein product [Heligmosomoides polygyrus]